MFCARRQHANRLSRRPARTFAGMSRLHVRLASGYMANQGETYKVAATNLPMSTSCVCARTFFVYCTHARDEPELMQ
jgi:hypothetical protein